MPKISEAPIAEKLADDQGKARPAWVEFYADLTRGDVGTSWQPTIANLTAVGTPTISGVYYQNSGFTDFAAKIVPATSTSSVFSSTTISLPFNVTVDTACFVVFGSTVLFGIINASTKQVFLPTWTGITTPVTITGRVKN